MDLNELKNFIHRKGERIILMENGNPVLVLLSYNDYEALTGGVKKDAQGQIFNNSDNSDKSLANKNENQPPAGSELTLEDLPF